MMFDYLVDESIKDKTTIPADYKMKIKESEKTIESRKRIVPWSWRWYQLYLEYFE